MWIFALTGFVSIVEVRGKPDRLLVRGRDRKDVAAWCRLVTGRARVRRTPLADYPWRFTASRKQVARAMARVVEGVDYDNFKGAVGHADPGRAHAYMDVWGAMRRFGDSQIDP